MKNLIFVFLLSYQCFSQDSIKPTRSVVSADKMNVVYRGIINPISIAVPEAKSFKATGLGLLETDVKGRYNLAPGIGLESKITIEMIMSDNSIIVEEKIFRIKNLKRLGAFVNGSFCYNCILELSKKDLETAEIELKIDDFLPDYKFYPLESFTVNFSNKTAILVSGNKLEKVALKEIKKLKVGSIFTLNDFHYSNPLNFCLPNINSVKIMIVEEKAIEE